MVKKERVSPYDVIKKTMSFLTQENDSKGVYIDEILSGNSSLGSLSLPKAPRRPAWDWSSPHAGGSIWSMKAPTLSFPIPLCRSR